MTQHERIKIFNMYILKAQMLGLTYYKNGRTTSIDIWEGVNAFFFNLEAVSVVMAKPTIHIDTHLAYHEEIFEVFLIEMAKRRDTVSMESTS